MTREEIISGVDCIDRKATLNAIIKRLGIKNETYLLEAERVIYQQILAMPSVTPQPRKGHWIKIGDRGFGYSDIVICKCSECEHQEEFVGKFDGHNLIVDAERADNYCSNCGANMKEVVEE